MTDEQLAQQILTLVGGKENVNSLIHCVTRLRFKLKDESSAKTEQIKGLDGVMTVVKSGGQYQVVIGENVADIYDKVMPHLNPENTTCRAARYSGIHSSHYFGLKQLCFAGLM
jgi:PTS system beta-glucosides-specific IIC component